MLFDMVNSVNGTATAGGSGDIVLRGLSQAKEHLILRDGIEDILPLLQIDRFEQ